MKQNNIALLLVSPSPCGRGTGRERTSSISPLPLREGSGGGGSHFLQHPETLPDLVLFFGAPRHPLSWPDAINQAYADHTIRRVVAGYSIIIGPWNGSRFIIIERRT